MGKPGWILGAIFVSCLAGGISAPAQNQPVDFSAIDKLWDIIAVLEKDGEPADEVWTDLIGTPGYAALISHEPRFGLDFLRRNLRLVFKPSLTVELEKVPRSAALRHFLDLKAKKDALQEFQAEMKNPTVWTEAVKLLKAWLPAGIAAGADIPPAAFIVFDKDARGGYGPMIFDLVYAFEQGGDFKALFAHEAFHYYRGKSAAFDPGSVLVAHRGVLNVLNMIQDEGMADQIDKPSSIFGNGSRADSAYAVEFRKNMAASPRILGALDELLCRLSDSPLDYGRISSEMSAVIPQSGHPTGYFMARAVLDNGGGEELVRTFDNPFAFFYLYNAAALRNSELPRLTNGALAVLQDLETLYFARPEKSLAAAARGRGVDLSAAENFEKIVRILMKGKEPEPSMWDLFFGNPGYRILFSREGDSRAALRNAISLAFRPEGEDELERALESGGSGVVQHFLNHKKDLDAVSRSAERLRDSGQFEEALAKVKTLLPRDSKEALDDAVVHLIYFKKDLRFGYPAMLLDPLWHHASPEKTAGYFRTFLLWRFKELVRPYDRGGMTERQGVFLDGWEDVQHRGLLDLLARDVGATGDAAFEKRYAAGMNEVPRLLGGADRIMARAAADPTAWREFEALSRDFLVYPGSPTGYFMAAAVEEAFGRDALAETTGCPPAFIRLYQKAAERKGGLPVFSGQALEFITRLEKETSAAKRSPRPD